MSNQQDWHQPLPQGFYLIVPPIFLGKTLGTRLDSLSVIVGDGSKRSGQVKLKVGCYPAGPKPISKTQIIKVVSHMLQDTFNFLSKDQLTKKKDRILIKDLISNKWKYKTKSRLILQSGIYYLLTNISEGMAFLLQGLTYNETLQFENKK